MAIWRIGSLILFLISIDSVKCQYPWNAGPFFPISHPGRKLMGQDQNMVGQIDFTLKLQPDLTNAVNPAGEAVEKLNGDDSNGTPLTGDTGENEDPSGGRKSMKSLSINVNEGHLAHGTSGIASYTSSSNDGRSFMNYVNFRKSAVNDSDERVIYTGTGPVHIVVDNGRVVVSKKAPSVPNSDDANEPRDRITRKRRIHKHFRSIPRVLRSTFAVGPALAMDDNRDDDSARNVKRDGRRIGESREIIFRMDQGHGNEDADADVDKGKSENGPIAADLNLTLDQVKTRITRAIKRILKALRKKPNKEQ